MQQRRTFLEDITESKFGKVNFSQYFTLNVLIKKGLIKIFDFKYHQLDQL